MYSFESIHELYTYIQYTSYTHIACRAEKPRMLLLSRKGMPAMQTGLLESARESDFAPRHTRRLCRVGASEAIRQMIIDNAHSALPPLGAEIDCTLHCIAFGGLKVEEAVAAEVSGSIQPGAIKAACKRNSRKRSTWMIARRLEGGSRSRALSVERAFWQYDATDPQNRCGGRVGTTLETDARMCD